MVFLIPFGSNKKCYDGHLLPTLRKTQHSLDKFTSGPGAWNCTFPVEVKGKGVQWKRRMQKTKYFRELNSYWL